MSIAARAFPASQERPAVSKLAAADTNGRNRDDR